MEKINIFFIVFVSYCAAEYQPRPHARGPLHDYIQKPDNTYSYQLAATYPQDGFTTYMINMTSQTWKDTNWSDKPVWWHWVTIHVPDQIDPRFEEAAFFYVSTGNNERPDEVPGPDSHSHLRYTAEMCNSTKMVTAVIRQIPFQPIFFPTDIENRYEDSIIAYTWRTFIDDPSDPEVIVRFPMVKAVVRAMDTVTDFVKGQLPSVNIKDFMVAGESKRGWTTWLTGAMDRRVNALGPVVLSCLNLIENFHHYYQSLGNWPFAFADYYAEGITGEVENPNLQELANIVDPYVYRDLLTMPKLIVSGASDEFFMIDDSHYWWDDLVDPKYFWILENTGHSINSSPLVRDYWAMMGTFYMAVLTDFQFPQVSWQRNETETSGSISFTTSVLPNYIKSWAAVTTDHRRRDFRNMFMADTIPPYPSNITWIESDVPYLGDGNYLATYDKPSEGWLAFFIKVSYDGPDGRPITFSSEANIIPDTFPFPRCSGSECLGFLT